MATNIQVRTRVTSGNIHDPREQALRHEAIQQANRARVALSALMAVGVMAGVVAVIYAIVS